MSLFKIVNARVHNLYVWKKLSVIIQISFAIIIAINRD